MKEFLEVNESIVEFTEAKDDNFLGALKFPFGKAEIMNKNKHFYPFKIFDHAVTGLNTRAEKGAGVIGQLDHPIGTGSTLLANASHILTKVWMDSNKEAWAEAKIFDTSRGRDLLAILKSGAKIGSSLRGYGEIDKDGKIKAGLEIKTVDLVVDPSFGASASVDQSNVFESFVPEGKYEFNENDLQEITSAMDTLSDATIAAIQEKLAKEENIEMTAGKVKALALWIRMSKDNPNIPPFHKWFEEQQQLFAQNDPNRQQELNEELRRQANIKEEKNIAGVSYGTDRRRIEERQKEIDSALQGKTMSEKTISRLFAEACLAGYKGSRADWIKKFGF